MKKEVIEYIRAKLREVEKEHNINIIHAIESGSRAWGFPSKDSDYDVRFLYINNLDHYLSIDQKRDVIDTPIVLDDFLGVEFDMNGWDIKKAITLATRGNAVVNEWLSSPVQYIVNEPYYGRLRDFIQETADLRAYFYFYRNYMRDPWNSYSKESKQAIKIKQYCYVLRCALSLEWLETQMSPPPMDLPSIFKGIEIDPELRSEIDQLISNKAEATEADYMPRSSILDNFIDNAISEERKRPAKDELEKCNLDKANALFREFIQ